MRVFYLLHSFDFEYDSGDHLRGQLLLNDEQRIELQSLLEEEDEWYLDNEGERLLPDELFLRSPWSAEGPSGMVKALCRFIDVQDGAAWFQTQDAYPGELFR